MCKKDTAVAQTAPASLAAKRGSLSAQQTTVNLLISRSSGAQQAYAPELYAQITAAVDQKQRDLNQQIEIIDEWTALEQRRSTACPFSRNS